MTVVKALKMAERKLNKKAMKERIRAKKLESVFKASPKPAGRGNVPPAKEISKEAKKRLAKSEEKRAKIKIYNSKKAVAKEKEDQKLIKQNQKRLAKAIKESSKRDAKAFNREMESILKTIENLASPSLSFGAKPMDENKLEKILFVESDIA